MASAKWREDNQDKMRLYRREWYARNKVHARSKVMERRATLKIWLRNLKQYLACSKCGENHFSCLEFHHQNPKIKDKPVSATISDGWSKERILREIEKCIVLCANCHRKMHFRERNRKK